MAHIIPPPCTAARFAGAPHTLIGSTFAGHLVCWDARARSTPVQRSAAGGGHVSPIYCLEAEPRYSRDIAEMPPRYSRDNAEIPPRCRRDTAEMPPRYAAEIPPAARGARQVIT